MQRPDVREQPALQSGGPMMPTQRLALWLIIVLGGARPSQVVGQQTFRLVVETGKAEFFEGEPVYFLVRLTNAGRDSAWVTPPELTTRTVILWLTREDGTVVPELRLWVDHYYPQGWSGWPIAPAETRSEAGVLQNFYGDGGPRVTPVYHRHLNAGRYRLMARYNPSLPDPDAPRLEHVESPGVVFAIRPRTGAEEAAYREIERVRAMAWNARTQRQYLPTLVELAAQRQALDSADVFLPFLLGNGLATAEALGSTPDRSTKERLFRMRVAAARASRETPGGALAALGVLSERPADAEGLAVVLGPSLAGEMVQEGIRRLRGRPLH